VIPRVIELAKSGSLAELGLKARKFATKNNWQQIADEFERILNKAIEEKKSRGEWI
jgi:hypothetical protein